MTQNSPSLLKRFFTSSALALLVTGGLMAVTVSDASAQRSRKEAEAPQEGRQFSSKTGQIVLTAQEFMSADNYAAAIPELSSALALPDINAYERGVINQLLGNCYYQNNNYSAAIGAFEAAMRSGGLLPKESSSLRVNIAQLLIASDQFARGAQMLEDWNRSGGQLKPAHVEMLWQAWSQAEQYSRALPWAERWFNSARPKERKHFDLLNFMYNNLNMPAKQADIVKQMINRWPEDKQLWDAWASMLANGGREQEAFEVSKMLYLGGAYNSQQELEKVVQYYSFYDMPFQAAQILEREMNAGRIAQTPAKLVQLSDLLRQSREYKRAIPILEKAAASSGKPKLYADLGEALFNEGQCIKAETAFKKAMTLGFDQGKAWMLIANCRYDAAAAAERLKCSMSPEARKSAPWSAKRELAIAAFDNVPVSSREAGNARKWKRFIRAERSAVDNRCIFEKNVEKERCYLAIKQAYSNVVFAGGFILDEQCQSFVEKYDSLYRVRIGSDD